MCNQLSSEVSKAYHEGESKKPEGEEESKDKPEGDSKKPEGDKESEEKDKPDGEETKKLKKDLQRMNNRRRLDGRT